MTSRQRVQMALRHEEPDMVPIDFGAMRSTGINAVAYSNLKKHLGISGGATYVYDVFQWLAKPEPEVLDILGGDVVQLDRQKVSFGISNEAWRESKLSNGDPCMVPAEFNPVINDNGDEDIYVGGRPMYRRAKGSQFFDTIYFPYSNAGSIDDIKDIRGDFIDDEEAAYLEGEAKRLYETTDRAILGAFGGNLFEAGPGCFGYEKFFELLAVEPDLIHAFNRKLTDDHLLALERYLGAVGRYIDVIQFGDDLGTQQSSTISKAMYRELYKPYHAELFQYVRKNYPNVKVFLHCCGAVYSLIPDLIDAGLEVLNPVQLSAAGMDAGRLKAEFGSNLSFWGGGVSTQTTVTSGSVEDIAREVRENMGIFAPGGGFVFTQVHNIQSNISPDKVMSIYDTANACRRYPVGK